MPSDRQNVPSFAWSRTSGQGPRVGAVFGQQFEAIKFDARPLRTDPETRSMSMTPKDTSLHAYQMLLYRTPVHPEFFQIGGRAHMQQANYECEAWIHPGGHTVRFEHDGATITEVVVPEGATVPERGVLNTIPCVGEKDFEDVYSDRISFVTSIQTEALSEHLYMGSWREMLEHGQQSECLMVKGDPTDGLPNLSVLEMQRYADQIHIQSYHFMGDGGFVLRTQSILQAGTHPME